ncbi:unnamed protein product [Orchesella dallaii]|uniref:Uncharacterized protein n=1 Tax=Orchesella dallaii TaxID=48710 RepID=A0ABP1R012_9HEXA
MSNPPCVTVADCPLPDPDDNCPEKYYKELRCCFGQCDCCGARCCEFEGCAGDTGYCHNPYEGGCGAFDDC